MCICIFLGISVNSIYLSENFAMECDMLRYIAEEVLNALDFLHKNNVLHRDIRSSCVFIDKFGKYISKNQNTKQSRKFKYLF